MKKELLSILGLGAIGAAQSLSKKVNSGKNTKQRISQEQRKAKNARKRKRKAQKNSRRRNRK